jgi:arabinofuranosyltransferase
MAWRYRWIGDDGFINLRVVQQIASGNGPVFNKGERIEAGTSPLWIAVLAVADLVTPVRLEWLAVMLGMAGAVTGVAFATLGSWRLVAERRDELALPIGAIAFVAVPAVWTYSTAGLEGGLSLAWIGVSWWCLTRASSGPRRDRRPDRPVGVSILLGLGPLVRPDFLVISGVFLGAWLLLNRAGGWPARGRALLYAVAIPLVVEVLRMGYYGLLVPNTALAKEAGSTYWQQGWYYLTDFGTTYWLLVPILALLVLVVALVRAAPERDRFATSVLAVAPLLAASLLTLYWVRIGGDWMHARVLLPAFFCFVLPTMVVRLRSWRSVFAVVVVAWALWCGVALREPAAGNHQIVDPRWSPAHFAKGRQIVTIDDWHKLTHETAWTRARHFAESGGSGILLFHPGTALDPLPIKAHHGDTADVVQRGLPIGMVAYATGPDVYIADGYGLADPIGSHLRLEKRGRPGHEKLTPTAWVLARFGRPGDPMPMNYEAFNTAPTRISERDVAAGRRALRCDGLERLIDAVDEPLTPGRFLSNVFDAPSLTELRFASEPPRAERELCAGDEHDG